MTYTRHTRHWMLIIIIVVVVLGLRAKSHNALSPVAFFDSERPLVIAHRGGGGLRPENTLAAFRHAARLGVDVLELDVHASSDGVLVVMHDETADRTTNGRGAIKTMLAADIKNLDAAYHWLPEESSEQANAIPPFRGEGIAPPTLVDVLEAFPSMRFNIEIKQYEPSISAALCNVLHETKVHDRVLVAADNSAASREFRDLCSDIPTAAYQSEVVWFMLNQKAHLLAFYQPKAYVLEVPVESYGIPLISKSIVASARRQGMHVLPWTINDKSEMRKLLADGVSGIITDYPDRLLSVIAELDDELDKELDTELNGAPTVENKEEQND